MGQPEVMKPINNEDIKKEIYDELVSSTRCRVLEGGYCEITQGYKEGLHGGIDVVGPGYTLAWEVAHSDGEVVAVKNNCNDNTYPSGPNIYGNYVKIKHDNGYYTLYAHGAYNTSQVNVGERVARGQRLMYMGNTGYSNGGHLHWEVRNPSDKTIDPTPYLDADLPSIPTPSKYKIGDTVDINGVYVSSDSTDELTPAITRGTITRIIAGARNPYLLDNGYIGWVNDNCIIGIANTKYLYNPNYKGTSIVDALAGIGVDSSFKYREKLAKANGITNYIGSAEQNTQMLNMLKNGTLKSV